MFLIDQNSNITLTKGDTAIVKLKLIEHDRTFRELRAGEISEIIVKPYAAFDEANIKQFENGFIVSADDPNYIIIEPEYTRNMKAVDYVYSVRVQTESGDIYTVIPIRRFKLTN